ncbi:MAG: pyruvate formate-lyase-activating protein [Bacilli bacterium]
MLKGLVHSVESCGTVDGPGIRYIVFLQGCLLRCQYCHNADTWKMNSGMEMTADEILREVETYEPFMKASGGGITVSGGEPLLQIDFLIELFGKCKARGIHTCLDTSAGCADVTTAYREKVDALFAVTDLILLDLKHIDDAKHRVITGQPNGHILNFARYASEKNQPVWIRYVLVPTVTDDAHDLDAMGQFIGTLSNVEKVEVLAYHQLGVYKWETLGLKYPLEGIETPSEEEVSEAYKKLTAYQKK